MFSFLVVSLFLGFVATSAAPSGSTAVDKCWFLFDNTSGTKKSTFNITSASFTKAVTGIITIDGNVTIPSTGLKKSSYYRISFKKNLHDIPLELSFFVSTASTKKVNISASESSKGTTQPFAIENIAQSGKINFQVSDLNAVVEKSYAFYPYKNGTYLTNNFGSDTEWKRITDVAYLTDTTQVSGIADIDTQLYNLKYMSVCSNSLPTVNISTIPEFEIGKDYNITCIGSGAPYLSVKWDTSCTAGIQGETKTLDKSKADHVTTSTIQITNFSKQHIGSYKCSVSNDNFGDKEWASIYVTPKYKVSFQSDTFYVADSGDLELVWNVTGWPFDSFTVSCTPSADKVNSTDSVDSQAPPSKRYTLTFNNGIKADKLECTLKNGTSTIATTTVYRVGWNCTAGQYGDKNTCNTCPTGQTSSPHSTTCHASPSNCSAGEYGVNDMCSVCPAGTVSDEHKAVKVEDCVAAYSTCTKGTYGTDKTTCLSCPFGSTSNNQAVKIQECFNVSNACEENYYGIDGTCSLCPVGYLSDKGAVKLQDCVNSTANSTCQAGSFGTKTSQCHTCPFGKVSTNLTVKIEDCFSGNSTCLINYYGINGNCKPCHFGLISKGGAAKKHDCHWVNSTCAVNYYGISDTCSVCPVGTVSPLRAHKVEDCRAEDCKCAAGDYAKYGAGFACSECVPCPQGSVSKVNANAKELDCFKVASQCPAGSYGEGSACFTCPAGFVSPPRSVKIQECLRDDSRCTAGQYGYGDVCTNCPKGTTSPAQSKSVADCVSTKQNVKIPFIAGVGGALFLVLALFVGTVIRYFVKKRRVDQRWKIAFGGDMDENTLVVENACLDDNDDDY